MEEYARRLDQLIHSHRTAYDAARRQVFGAAADRLPPPTPPLPSLTDHASFEEALAAYDAWAAAALDRERDAWIAARVPERTAEPAPAAHGLEQVNGWMEALFDLRRLLPGVDRRNPTILVCVDAAAFAAPLRAAGVLAAGQPPPDVPAFYLPGRGCFVNGARLAREAGTATPAAALTQPELFFRAVRAVAAELWGWGFLLEHTPEGQERLAAGVWREELRLRLGIPSTAPPPPAWAAAAVALSYSALSTAAWCAWIADRLEQAARRAQRRSEHPPERSRRNYWSMLARLARQLMLAIPTVEIADGIREVLQDVLADDDAGLQLLHGHINRLRRWGDQYEALSLQHTGRSLRGWLAGRLLERVEAQVGAYCLPYALLLAHHVSYDLARVQAAALAARLEREPRLAIDTRLRLLAGLDASVKYNPTALRTAAWERLQIDGPPLSG